MNKNVWVVGGVLLAVAAVFLVMRSRASANALPAGGGTRATTTTGATASKGDGIVRDYFGEPKDGVWGYDT